MRRLNSESVLWPILVAVIVWGYIIWGLSTLNDPVPTSPPQPYGYCDDFTGAAHDECLGTAR